MAALSAAGSLASIGSLVLELCHVRPSSTKNLDNMLEKTGKNIEKASNVVEQHAEILKPAARADALKSIQLVTNNHIENIGRQGLADEHKLSRAARRAHEQAVKSNLSTSNRVFMGAQADSQKARTEQLLNLARAERAALSMRPICSAAPQISVSVNIPQSPTAVHLAPLVEDETAVADSSEEPSRSAALSQDPFVDPTLQDQSAEPSAPLEIELQSIHSQATS